MMNKFINTIRNISAQSNILSTIVVCIKDTGNPLSSQVDLGYPMYFKSIALVKSLFQASNLTFIQVNLTFPTYLRTTTLVKNQFQTSNQAFTVMNGPFQASNTLFTVVDKVFMLDSN